MEDGVARLRVPLLHAFFEGLPANRLFRGAFFSQLLLDHVLGGDRGMVGAGHPETGVSQHSMPPDQHVLERVHGVAHV